MLRMIEVGLSYFDKGEYSYLTPDGNNYDEWAVLEENKGKDTSYQVWLETVLKPWLDTFQKIELYSDATMYGSKNGVVHVFTDEEFDCPEMFDQIAEEGNYKVETIDYYWFA